MSKKDLKEDAPVNCVGSGGFTGAAAATGPVAGFDPLLGGSYKKKLKKLLKRQGK